MMANAQTIDVIFDLCVQLLQHLAAICGTTYNAVNVWIFCVIWPVFTLGLIWRVVCQRAELQLLRQWQRDTKPTT